MKIIEIIGPPCTGKTYLRYFLTKELKKRGIKVNTYFSVFFKYVFKENDLSLLDIITLYYFKFFKLRKEKEITNVKKIKNRSRIISKSFLKNLITSFLYTNYYKVCKKIINKKNFQIYNIIISKIKKNNKINNNDRNAYLWFIEIFAILNLLEKHYKKNDIILDDEGIFQKLFIFSEIKFEKKFFNKYIKSINNIHLLLHTNSSKKKIISRSICRKGTNKFSYNDKSHLDKILKFDKKIKKHLIKFGNFKFKDTFANKEYLIVNYLMKTIFNNKFI